MHRILTVPMISLFLVCSGHAEILHVPAQYVTIQGAINASMHGDEILVAPGTYIAPNSEQVVDMYGREVWLHSSGGPGVTIIDGQDQRRGAVCVSYETPGTIIEGFTITRCTNDGPLARGGGILCIDSSPTIRDCIIQGNWGVHQGGGISCDNSDPVITGCQVLGNESNYGAGIWCYYSSPVITGCSIIGNIGQDNCGGVLIGTSSNTIIQDCLIQGNVTLDGQFGSGGGVLAFHSTGGQLVNCHLQGNTAASMGGGVACHEAEIFISGCAIEGNTATLGGGVHSFAGTATVTESTFCSNWYLDIYGDWIDLGGNTFFEVCLGGCPADLDDDGLVGFSDLLVLLADWGCSGCASDIDGSGYVNFEDLLILLGTWGQCEG